jgi:anaerobic selenocysteine-containing dehydrogenase
VRSHVHPSHVDREAGQFVLLPTFRLPTLIHTRSGNSKWLYEISHRNPVWIHPQDAAGLGVETDDLLRLTTDIGYFVSRCWVTEGIRPGVVACSHHMGRWRLQETANERWSSALVSLEREGASRSADLAAAGPAPASVGGEGQWRMRHLKGTGPFESADPDSMRIWWTDVGVHQNLTFPVHPDPVSGMHCWHQRVTVERAREGDRLGDISVDTARSRAVYREWMAMTRPARDVSPDGNRRPLWLLRPFRPTPETFKLPATRGEPHPGAAAEG